MPPFVGKPLALRGLYRTLLRTRDIGRNPTLRDLAKKRFGLTVGEQVARRYAERELGEAVIEERHPQLFRPPHRHAVIESQPARNFRRQQIAGGGGLRRLGK